MLLTQGVECYGELDEYSNFHVVFIDDEGYEGGETVWCEGLPEGTAYTWINVVTYLCAQLDDTIVEISAV